MSAERDQFERDPDYPYYQRMEEAFARAGSPHWIDEVVEIWFNTSKALAHYLSSRLSVVILEPWATDWEQTKGISLKYWALYSPYHPAVHVALYKLYSKK